MYDALVWDAVAAGFGIAAGIALAALIVMLALDERKWQQEIEEDE